MSRFSKADAEAAGWVIVHEREERRIITSEEQGESRLVPASYLAEKYQPLPNGSAQMIHEEASSMGLLLERIHAYEEQQKSKGIEPEGIEVDLDAVPVNSEGYPIRTVLIEAEDGEVVAITEEELAQSRRSEALYLGPEKGMVFQSGVDKVNEAVAQAAARSADEQPAIVDYHETEQIDLDPNRLVDAPGATGTGRLIVRKGEDVDEIVARRNEDHQVGENARVVAGAGASEEPPFEIEESKAEEADLDGDLLEVVPDPEPQDLSGEGSIDVAEERSEGIEEKAKELRDDSDAEGGGDKPEQYKEAAVAGHEAVEEAAEEVKEEASDDDESKEVELEPGESVEVSAKEATPAAEALAEEKGVDLSEVEGSGADGKILKSDVEKA